MLRKFLLPGILLSSALCLTGCYRIPIPQGNILDQQEVNKVRIGMTPTEVINSLGNPVLNNTFVNGQLAYVYTLKLGTSPMKKKRLIIYFKNNKVSRIQADSNQITSQLPYKN